MDSVVKCLVVQEEDHRYAKEYLDELSNKWFESLYSHIQTSECVSAANGWKECGWAYNDVYLELSDEVGPFKQSTLKTIRGCH